MKSGRFAIVGALLISGIVAAISVAVMNQKGPSVETTAGEAGPTSVVIAYDRYDNSLDGLILKWEADNPGYTVTSCRREPVPDPRALWECTIFQLI